jgi:hypothetical protein
MLLEVVLGLSVGTAMLFLPYLVKGFKISHKIELVAQARLKGSKDSGQKNFSGKSW